ncbi:hypothetical protein [Calothrix sp. PCC 6303]|uniref:hypothetical protein n=1 Tax=Calothrix sp. PCC 6303 TaxID=1170562 RepID=UPI0002A00895|nr:hypothetical protein [Calothrix sp. PCC 6303]AFZ01481.1 peptidase S8/S53 subtilisin kexin sedolisin [Calothrix sp. PCC 6303]
MKRFLSSLVLAGCFLTSTSLPLIPHQYGKLAQAQTTDELFYTFYGQKIPLNLKRDRVAVSFKPTTNSRSSRSTQPLYLQLQQDLRDFQKINYSIGNNDNHFKGG